jgi:outer membrane protein assembly factor BamE (lipoprotein component of BamABCDE complex)
LRFDCTAARLARLLAPSILRRAGRHARRVVIEALACAPRKDFEEPMKLAMLKVSTVVLAAALMAGCATNRAHKGAVLDPQLVSSIHPGVDNKASVQKLLGGPTFAGEFNPNDWYYVSRDTNQLAFRNPRVTRQTVMLVRFDGAGNVASVQNNGKEFVMNLNPSKRSTPTLGRRKSFFDEIFGNIGTVGAPGITNTPM